MESDTVKMLVVHILYLDRERTRNWVMEMEEQPREVTNSGVL